MGEGQEQEQEQEDEWHYTGREHRRGAGEDETYATPVKAKRDPHARGIRWYRGLFMGPVGGETPPEEVYPHRALPAPTRGCLVDKDYNLDRHGNVRSGDAPPTSPRYRRVKVKVSKIIYDDDEEAYEEDAYAGEAGSVSASEAEEVF